MAWNIPEAWKAKQKEDYFFGSVDANRVQFSTGRDLEPSPKAGWSSAKLLLLPVCRSGKPYDKFDKQFSFEEFRVANGEYIRMRQEPRSTWLRSGKRASDRGSAAQPQYPS